MPPCAGTTAADRYQLIADSKYMETSVLLRVGASTSPGRRRPDNQDFLLYRIRTAEPDAERDLSLFVAADGVGGAVGGALASKLAAQAVAATIPSDGVEDPSATLRAAARAADAAVSAGVAADPAMRGMGTTLVIALVREGVAWVANIGDSRGYLLRDGTARQITEDHSLVAERVRSGRISLEQAATSPYRHFITRSIGGEEDAEADIFGPLPLQPGDRLLLCTDGLTETMTDEEFAPLALANDPEAAARALVDEANRRGGPDNVSVLLIEAV